MRRFYAVRLLPLAPEEERHRLECEARFWLAMPLIDRRAALARIEKNRGTAATERLKAEMTRQHEIRSTYRQRMPRPPTQNRLDLDSAKPRG